MTTKITYTTIKVLFILCILFNLNLSAQTAKPNIVFFSADDLNDWVSPLGHSQAITPNLERLAAMGVTFTHAHAPATYCAPSRTAIWSGLNPSTTGYYADQILWHNLPNINNLQSVFKASGYKTYGAGKTYHHVEGSIDLRDWDYYYARTPEVKAGGFNMGYRGSDVPLPNPHPYGGYWNDPDVDITNFPTGGGFDWGPLQAGDDDKQPDALRAKFGADLIRCYSDEEPFFLAVGLYSPHYPQYVPQRFFDMYDQAGLELPVLFPSIENGWAEDLADVPEHMASRMSRRGERYQDEFYSSGTWREGIEGYLAAISFADYNLGIILDALEESGKIENTIIVFWSDQGYHHGEKGQWGKSTLWKQTSRVPLLFGGKINGASLPVAKIDKTVGLIDMYPTLVDICNLIPPSQALDGVSLWPVIQNPNSAEDKTVFMADEDDHWGGYALINNRWRYIKYRDGGADGTDYGGELYDLSVDPSEFNNLLFDGISAAEQAIIDQLEAEALPRNFAANAPSHRDTNLVVYPSGWYYRYNDSDPDPMIPEPASWPGSTCLDNSPIGSGGFIHEDFVETEVEFTLPRNESGMYFLANTDTEQRVVTDVDARYVPNGNYAYFDVSDAIISPTENIIYFGVTYLDDSNNTFEIQYNSTTINNKPFTVTRNNTGTWVTKTLMVVDAKFDNQLSGYDFRISGEVTLKSVIAAKPPYSDVSIAFDDPSVYNDNGFILNGIDYLFRTDRPDQGVYTLPGFIQDNHCRAIVELEDPTTGLLENKWGAFQLDTPTDFTDNQELEVSLTYFETGIATRFVYNAIVGGIPLRDKEISIPPTTNLNQWVTKTIRLEDAALDNSAQNSSSIRIGSNRHVKRLAINKNPTLNKDRIADDYRKVDFNYNRGILSITVPEGISNVDYVIYNLSGQVIVKKTKMNSHIEKIPLKVSSGLYILHVNLNGYRVVKKIVTGTDSTDRS